MTKRHSGRGSRPGTRRDHGARDIKHGSAQWNAGSTYGPKQPEAWGLAFLPRAKIPARLQARAAAARNKQAREDAYGPEPTPLYRTRHGDGYLYASSVPRGAKGWEKQAKAGHWYKVSK